MAFYSSRFTSAQKSVTQFHLKMQMFHDISFFSSHLHSPKLKEKSPQNVFVTDVDQAAYLSSTPPLRRNTVTTGKPARKYVVVSRKSNIRKYSADAATVAKQVAGLLPTGLEKRSRSLDTKQRPPPVARKPLLSIDRIRSNTAKPVTPSTTDSEGIDSRQSETDIDEIDNSVFHKETQKTTEISTTMNSKTSKSPSHTTSTKKTTTDGAVKPPKKFDTRTTSTSSLDNGSSRKVDQMVRLLTEANQNPIDNKTDKKENEVHQPVNHNLNNNTTKDLRQKKNSIEKQQANNEIKMKRTQVSENLAIEEYTTLEQKTPPSKIQTGPVTKEQNHHHLTMCDEPLAEEQVRTALTICHLEDEGRNRQHLFKEKEVIVNVPKSVLRNKHDSQNNNSNNSMERDNNKKNRDSWDILSEEQPQLFAAPSDFNNNNNNININNKSKKLEIESGLLSKRKMSSKDQEKPTNNNQKENRESHQQKHNSWNILDLKPTDDPIEEFLRSGSLGSRTQLVHQQQKQRNKSTPDDISFLFEQYQRKRKSLKRLQEKKESASNKRYSVGSMSDFSDISSVSDEDEEDRLNDLLDDVSDVEDPETFFQKANDITQQQTRPSTLSMAKPTEETRLYDHSDIRNDNSVKQEKNQPPVVLRRNKRGNDNNSDNPLKLLSPEGHTVESTKIKPLPSPVKPDFVPEVSTFSEEDLGSMVMAQAVSAVRKRRGGGGRGRRDVNAEIIQKLQKEKQQQQPEQPQSTKSSSTTNLNKRQGSEEENAPKVPERPPSPVIKDLISKRSSPRSPPPPRQQQQIKAKMVAPLSLENVQRLNEEDLMSMPGISGSLDDGGWCGFSSNSTATTVKTQDSSAKLANNDKHKTPMHLISSSLKPSNLQQQRPRDQKHDMDVVDSSQQNDILNINNLNKQRQTQTQQNHQQQQQINQDNPPQKLLTLPLERETRGRRPLHNIRSYDYVSSMPDIHYNSTTKSGMAEIEHCESEDFNNSDTSFLSDIGMDSTVEGSVVGDQLFVYPSLHMRNLDGSSTGVIKSKAMMSSPSLLYHQQHPSQSSSRQHTMMDEFSDSSGDESFTTEQTDRFRQTRSSNGINDTAGVGSNKKVDGKTERTVYCGYGSCSHKQVMVGNERSKFIACNSCFTCYCSKTCKRLHWSAEHRKSCFFGRINVYIKTMVRRCERDVKFNAQMRVFALKNYRAHGRGCVILSFNSPSEAKEMASGRNGTGSSSDKTTQNQGSYTSYSYSTISDVVKKNKQSKHSKVLCQSLLDYDPEQEFVINISIRIGKTRTTTNSGSAKKRTSNVVRCARVSSLESGVSEDSFSSYYIRTFCLPRVAAVDYTNDVEVRRYYCKELSFSLKRCGVRLKLDYPEAYEKLSRYVEDERAFLPIVLYGQKSGKNFKCILHQGKYNPSEEARGEGVLV